MAEAGTASPARALGAAEVPTGVREWSPSFGSSQHTSSPRHPLQNPRARVPAAFNPQSHSRWLSIQLEVFNPSKFPVGRGQCSNVDLSVSPDQCRALESCPLLAFSLSSQGAAVCPVSLHCYCSVLIRGPGGDINVKPFRELV